MTARDGLPDAPMLARAVDRIAAWHAMAQGAGRVAMVLSTYPGRDWQQAHAVGLDALRYFWSQRTPEELARIAALVRSAIGFDERRGDKVEVVSMRFVEEAGGPAEP